MGAISAYNRDLAEALVQIAREWVKVDAATLAELKKLMGKMPTAAVGPHRQEQAVPAPVR